MESRPDDTKPRRRRRKSSPAKGSTALLCLGLDGKDGHTRITQGEAFLLVGGSEETHERMQDFTIKLTKALEERGTRLSDATPRELRDVASEID